MYKYGDNQKADWSWIPISFFNFHVPSMADYRLMSARWFANPVLFMLRNNG